MIARVICFSTQLSVISLSLCNAFIHSSCLVSLVHVCSVSKSDVREGAHVTVYRVNMSTMDRPRMMLYDAMNARRRKKVCSLGFFHSNAYLKSFEFLFLLLPFHLVFFSFRFCLFRMCCVTLGVTLMCRIASHCVPYTIQCILLVSLQASRNIKNLSYTRSVAQSSHFFLPPSFAAWIIHQMKWEPCFQWFKLIRDQMDLHQCTDKLLPVLFALQHTWTSARNRFVDATCLALLPINSLHAERESNMIELKWKRTWPLNCFPFWHLH